MYYSLLTFSLLAFSLLAFSLLALARLGFCTNSLYYMYWFYNWELLIYTFLSRHRCAFSPFFCFFCSIRRHHFAQVLCVSSRSWLSYAYQNRFHLTPLSYEVLEYASSFSSEQCPEGVVAIAQNTLRYVILLQAW